MATRADVIVYTISTNISGMKGKGDKTLERIAEATGGRSFFPFQMRDVSDSFLSIQEDSAASTRSLTSLRILSPMDVTVRSISWLSIGI